jgi:hypothetical protein
MRPVHRVAEPGTFFYMRASADIIALEFATPVGRCLQERSLKAMFLMGKFREVDAGWRNVAPHPCDPDVGADAIGRLAGALRP